MERYELIKKRLFEVEYRLPKTWWGEGESILTDSNKSRPLVIRKALAVEHTLLNMPIDIKPDELIVGLANMGSIGAGRLFPHYATEEELEAASLDSFDEYSVWGHHPANYEKILTLGIEGILSEVEVCLQKELNEEQRNFYEAVKISLKAVDGLAKRYSNLLREKAAEESKTNRRNELLEMAEICSKVPGKPAATFHEALQGFWFTYIALQSTLEIVPIGRSDYYLYPFYKADFEAGRLSGDRADELIVSWLAKFSERIQMESSQWEQHIGRLDWSDGGEADIAALYKPHTDESFNFGISHNHWLANMILGGQDEEGNDATTELTYKILHWWAYLEAVAPVMSVRIHKDSPEKLYDLCADILRHGSSEPAIYNDEQIIPGLCKLGVPLAEARGYSNDGCWETLIPGKTNYSLVNLELLQLLEYVFTRGRSINRDQEESLDTGSPLEFQDYDSFYAAFLKQMEHMMQRLLKNKIKYRYGRAAIAPSPLLSALMDDCISNGKDLSAGGARYNWFCFVLTGLSNTVDSLAAVKKIVYDSGKVSMSNLVRAMLSNYEGQEVLRQTMIKAPKFGNDDAYVDSIAKKLLADAKQILDRVNETCGEADLGVPLAIGTFENYAKYGYMVGATADGRKAHEAISSNYSPSLGVDIAGPTAAINSVTYPDLLPYVSGCPLDLQINPHEVAGEFGLGRMKGLIRSFLELGGIILTVTGLSEEQMRDAQRHPENHQSMRVRLGGFSAYFVALTSEQQEILIRRAGSQ